MSYRKKLWIILKFLGVFVILGTAGSSDLNAVSVGETLKGVFLGIALYSSGGFLQYLSGIKIKIVIKKKPFTERIKGRVCAS